MLLDKSWAVCRVPEVCDPIWLPTQVWNNMFQLAVFLLVSFIPWKFKKNNRARNETDSGAPRQRDGLEADRQASLLIVQRLNFRECLFAP